MDASEDGLLPLLFACDWFGSLDIIRFLASKYPEAAAVKTLPENKLPLHMLMYRFKDGERLPSDGVELLRVILRCHSLAAGSPDSDGITPYTMAVKSRMPTLIKRLLLRADPTIDPVELRRLNYIERRMAMFLAYSAVPQTMSDSFAVRLRRLANKHQTLLRLIVSFL
jgi:serine/threonine protein kinase HipA of HipAB toxin-antitoxin module